MALVEDEQRRGAVGSTNQQAPKAPKSERLDASKAVDPAPAASHAGRTGCGLNVVAVLYSAAEAFKWIMLFFCYYAAEALKLAERLGTVLKRWWYFLTDWPNAELNRRVDDALDELSGKMDEGIPVICDLAHVQDGRYQPWEPWRWLWLHGGVPEWLLSTPCEVDSITRFLSRPILYVLPLPATILAPYRSQCLRMYMFGPDTDRKFQAYTVVVFRAHFWRWGLTEEDVAVLQDFNRDTTTRPRAATPSRVYSVRAFWGSVTARVVTWFAPWHRFLKRTTRGLQKAGHWLLTLGTFVVRFEVWHIVAAVVAISVCWWRASPAKICL